MAVFSVKQICYFSAAHVLRGYPLACERLHGHNYKVIVEVSAETLNALGMVMDYVDIQNISNRHIEKLDHKYLNDLQPFDHLNPTAENVAQWLYEHIAYDIKQLVTDNNPYLKSITIWETDHNSVTYQPE